MPQPLQLDFTAGVAVVTLQSPPVKALGLAQRRALDKTRDRLRQDDSVEAVEAACRLLFPDGTS